MRRKAVALNRWAAGHALRAVSHAPRARAQPWGALRAWAAVAIGPVAPAAPAPWPAGGTTQLPRLAASTTSSRSGAARRSLALWRIFHVRRLVAVALTRQARARCRGNALARAFCRAAFMSHARRGAAENVLSGALRRLRRAASARALLRSAGAFTASCARRAAFLRLWGWARLARAHGAGAGAGEGEGAPSLPSGPHGAAASIQAPGADFALARAHLALLETREPVADARLAASHILAARQSQALLRRSQDSAPPVQAAEGDYP